MAAKDRRWERRYGFYGEPGAIPCSELVVRQTGKRIVAHSVPTRWPNIIDAHNADIDALEAENAKLRAVVEGLCGGPVTLEQLRKVREDALSYYGKEFCQGEVLKIIDALDALVEEGDDGKAD